jgi:hypothetical protein
VVGFEEIDKPDLGGAVRLVRAGAGQGQDVSSGLKPYVRCALLSDPNGPTPVPRSIEHGKNVSAPH